MKHDLNKAAAAYTKYVQASGEEYMDIEIPCNAADFIPSLIEVAEKQEQELERLREKERIYKISDDLYREKVKPIKHFFPLDNTPGIGQIVELVQKQQKKIEALETANDLLHDETKEQQQEIERLKNTIEVMEHTWSPIDI
ncbi:hypothetical protein AF332_07035 [Sporosarcina globispora]|uniref:Uncharacterized protein n=1 Tax=Sporosarcina globispora TaxID=1459 RepID=A0A0M0GAY7_SPOGL|nr:hypothetical protein [Sporosarcina globispora]KON86596.1 hypothetical protein AF332_07035 [Sporosarcina globispora]